MKRTLFSSFIVLALVFGGLVSTVPAQAIGTGSGGYVPPTTPAPEPTPEPTPTPAPTPVPKPTTPTTTPEPSTTSDVVETSALQCGNLATTRDRVGCRLRLTPEQLVAEQRAQYLPEECRTFAVGAVRDGCIARYKSFAPCWASAPGEARFTCARQALSLDRGVSTEAKNCAAIVNDDDRRDCVDELRSKVFDYIKFRFYDLEKRSEDLIDRGASVDRVAEFVTFITENKVAFNNAVNDAERRVIILQIREGWKQFLADVKPSLR